MEKKIEENIKSKGHRWRLKLKQLKKMSQPSTDDRSCDAEERLEVFDGEEEGSKTCYTPTNVQIIDAETHTDEMRPYTIYVIMATNREAGECV